MDTNNWKVLYRCQNKEFCYNSINYITKKDIIPKIIHDDDEERLVFVVKCPGCGYVGLLHKSLVPKDVANELLDKFHNSDVDVILEKWENEYVERHNNYINSLKKNTKIR